MTATTNRPVVTLTFEPRGAVRRLFRSRERQVLLAGPAGTGKTRGSLEWLHLCMSVYPGARSLILRKTHSSLTGTALVTYREKVLHPLDAVRFFGGNAQIPPQYRYPNGSRVMVGGMDNADKIMSSEYDMIYVNEATDLIEDDWEKCDTRLRNGVMPWQQLLADCNPDAPTHWLKQRCDAGKTLLLESRHEDNPAVYDAQRGAWTPEGAAYIAALDNLSGVRFHRLRSGRWVAAEGVVYDGWDAALHLVDSFPIPAEWPRYLVVDFGYTNPFVCQWWAADPDGRLFRYRELYRSQGLVEDHAAVIRSYLDAKDAAGRPLEPTPVAVICDHDAEGRATLRRHLGLGTSPAKKTVTDGIQAVAARFKPAGDGRPRLFLMRGALIERDPLMADKKYPTCTEEEIDGYVWNLADNRKKGEEPVKLHDHGCDAMRYMAAHLDLQGGVSYGPSIY